MFRVSLEEGQKDFKNKVMRGGPSSNKYADPISRGLVDQSIILKRAFASLSASAVHKLRSFIFAKVLEDTSSESQKSPSARKSRGDDSASANVVQRSPLASCHAFLQLCQTFFLSPMDAFRSASMDTNLAPYMTDGFSPTASGGTTFATASQEQVIHFFLRCIQGELSIASSSSSAAPPADIQFPLSLECAILLCSLIAHFQQAQAPIGTEGLELLRQVFAQCVEAEAAADEEQRLADTLSNVDDSAVGSPRYSIGREIGPTKISWATLTQRLASFVTGDGATNHPYHHSQFHDVSSELALVLVHALGTPTDTNALSVARQRKEADDASPLRRVPDEESDHRVSFDEFINHLRRDTFASGPDRARWRRRFIGSPTDDASLSPSSPTQPHQPMLPGLMHDTMHSDNAIFDINEKILSTDPISDMLVASELLDDALGDVELYDDDSFAAESSQSLASFTAIFEVTGPQTATNLPEQKRDTASSSFFGTSLTTTPPPPSAGILTTSPSVGNADGSVIRVGRGGVSIVPPSPKAVPLQQLDLGSSILGSGGPQMSASFAPASAGESLFSATKKLQAATRRKSTKKSPLSQPLGFGTSPLDHIRAKIDASVAKVASVRVTTDAKIERCSHYVKRDLAVLDGHTGVASAANSTSIAENSRRQPRQTHAYAPSMTEREDAKLKEMLDEYNVDREMALLEQQRAVDLRMRRRRVLSLKSRKLKDDLARRVEETSRTNSLISREEELVRSIAACMGDEHDAQAASFPSINQVEQRRRAGITHQQTTKRHKAERKSMHALHQLKFMRHINDEMTSSLIEDRPPSTLGCTSATDTDGSSSLSSLSRASSPSKRDRQHRPLPTPTPGPGETPKPRSAQFSRRRSAPSLNMSLSPQRGRTDDHNSSINAKRCDGPESSSPIAVPPGSYDLLVEADGVGVMRCTIQYVFSFADLLEALDDVFQPYQHDLKRHHNQKRPSLRGAGRRDTVMNLSLGTGRRRVSDVFLLVPADSVGVKTKYIPLGAVEELPQRAKVRVLFE
jgi:hypothetical protein